MIFLRFSLFFLLLSTATLVKAAHPSCKQCETEYAHDQDQMNKCLKKCGDFDYRRHADDMRREPSKSDLD